MTSSSLKYAGVVPPAKSVEFKWCLAPVIFLLMALLLSGCAEDKKVQAGEQEDTASVPVRVAAVEKGSLADTTLVTGKLEALQWANVVPGGQGGKVYSVNVKVGDNVGKGQTLVTLEHATLEAAIQQAQQGVVQAEAALEIAKINFEQAAANYERGKQLYDSGAVSTAGPSGFETAYEMPFKQAKIDYEQVKPAMVANARAALAISREQYDNAFIKSPINGVVTAVNVNPGELASSASAVPVVTVVSLDKMVVQAAVTEGQINKLKQGQEVPVKVSVVSTEPLTGVISSIALAVDPNSRAFPIKVQLDNPEHLLKPGMFAEVHLADHKNEVLLVPREAVITVSGRDMVWVIGDNKASSRPVTVGVSDGKQIEIKSGLQAGDQVVISGQDSLQENSVVQIVK